MRAVPSMRAFFLAAMVFSLSAGCGTDLAGNFPGGAGTSSTAGQPGAGDSPVSLAFEKGIPTELPARAEIELAVRALPEQVYSVVFALPTSGVEPLDAVLG